MDHSLEPKMEEKEPSDCTTRKRIKQSISVPFIWEVMPGIPKKDWKPTPSPAKPVAPPLKLIASVPFEWEEKPGTPLPCFKQPPPSSPLALLPAETIIFPPSPGNSRDNENSWIGITYQDGDETETEMLESDLETSQYETDDSFSSATSLMANGLISTMAISRAVPSQETFTKDLHNKELGSPASPASETDSSVSSYDTGTTSLTGASFLEWLFPLLTPRSSFLEKAACQEISVSHIQTKESKVFVPERNCTASIRRPTTLGELIMMSRRSYQRRAFQMQKQNFSKEIMKRNAFGCSIFGTSNILGTSELKWKRQLQLKLI